MNFKSSLLGIILIMVIMFSTASCRSPATTKTPRQFFTMTPMQHPVEKPSAEISSSTNITWENYIKKIAENRKYDLLYEQQDSLNLAEYLKKIVAEKPAVIDALKECNSNAFLIDLDKDGINELCLVQCEGSIRHYFVLVFKKKDESYVCASKSEGDIFPVKYNNEVHFISTAYDFQTKFKKSIIEYEVKGLAFNPKRIWKVNYTYDISVLPQSITKMIDNHYLNSLNDYKISDSNIAKITDIPGSSSFNVELVDNKNNNILKFKVDLWLTSVGYAPNRWYIELKDDRIRKFKGIDQVESKDGEESVCYGLKFYKDGLDNIFLLKVSYPFFTTKTTKDGDLKIQLFKFNKDSVEKVEDIMIEPKIEIKGGI